jgi:ubiquinone/menaquinone biosynthesis C-methylase UbiE
VDASLFKNKKAVDIGCGSGRFTVTFKRLGCSSVTGVDYGDEGLKIAQGVKESLHLSGVDFLKSSVLDLPFEDETLISLFATEDFITQKIETLD